MRIYLLWGFAGLAALLGSPAAAQTAPAAQAPATPEAQRTLGGRLGEVERTRRWLAYNMPGEAHARLAAFIGSWTITWSVWDRPGEAPDVSRGTATFEWLNGRRYVRGTYRGNVVGHRYDAQLTLGFDAFRAQYVAMWTTSMETAPMVYRGSARPAVGERFAGFELRGRGDDCVNGRFDLDYRAVFAVEPNGTIRETVYGPDEAGREFRIAEIVYVRRRA